MKTTTKIVLASLALGAFVAGPVCAAAAPGGKVPELKGSVPLLALACTAVAVAGICVVAFKKPKRAKGQ